MKITLLKLLVEKNALKVLGFDCGVSRLAVLSEKLEISTRGANLIPRCRLFDVTKGLTNVRRCFTRKNLKY
jgi:hypothetical protein